MSPDRRHDELVETISGDSDFFVFFQKTNIMAMDCGHGIPHAPLLEVRDPPKLSI